jgi:hypothetical protein
MDTVDYGYYRLKSKSGIWLATNNIDAIPSNPLGILSALINDLYYEQEHSMNTFVKLIMAMSLAGFLIGCEQGPAEDAGENIDEAVEEVQDEVDDAT